MDDLRQHHGNHTWDLVIDYHQCPSCGYIIEDRHKYEKRFTLLQKELECGRCHKIFTVTKQTRPTFGPLLGND